MKTTFIKVCVIGLGYIGLPTAAILASRKINVIGVDINQKTIDIINNGKIHIVEPDLESIIYNVVNAGYLKATTIPESSDAFIITVPTPFAENYRPDLSFIEAAVQSIAPVLKKGDLIILESTSPVGTTLDISKQFSKLRCDLIFPHQHIEQTDIHIAYCPERVMPGKILQELIHNDRIIGGITPQCTEKAKSLYELFVTGKCLQASSNTAEMVKLTENAFRDLNIAFANELSIICDKLEINVWELIRLANHHPRVKILQPGPGVGGHCIAVDPWFIVHSAPEESNLIRMARKINNAKPAFVIEKIKSALTFFKNPKIACLGITYKADTNDTRESPIIKILEELSKFSPATIYIVEPNICTLPPQLNSNHFLISNFEDAISSADIILAMVAHKEFGLLKTMALKNKIVIDMANLMEKQLVMNPIIPNKTYVMTEYA